MRGEASGRREPADEMDQPAHAGRSPRAGKDQKVLSSFPFIGDNTLTDVLLPPAVRPPGFPPFPPAHGATHHEVRRTSRRRVVLSSPCVRRAARPTPPIPTPPSSSRRASAPCWPTTACRATAPTSSAADCGSTPKPAFLKGADAGPVVVPGDPDKSDLVHAVRQDGDHKMPPAPRSKLPPEAVEALATWVKMGAPWPDGAAVAAKKIVHRRARRKRTGRSSRSRSRTSRP